MKTGMKVLILTGILIMVYTPIVVSYFCSWNMNRLKQRIELRNNGVVVGGVQQKYCIRSSAFEDYIEELDVLDNMTVCLWHERDSLFVEISGQDAYPGIRRTEGRAWNDSKAGGDDKIVLSVDFGKTGTDHINYQFTFGQIAFEAQNQYGRYKENSRRPCSVPWALEVTGKEWHFKSTIPIMGCREIGLNVTRKYYGGRDVSLSYGNDPTYFARVLFM